MDLLERILFQMLFMSHEWFSLDQIAQSSRGLQYFEPDGASVHTHLLFCVIRHSCDGVDTGLTIMKFRYFSSQNWSLRIQEPICL